MLHGKPALMTHHAATREADVPRSSRPTPPEGVTRVGSTEFRSAAESARTLFAAQEAARRSRRVQRWQELATQLLRTSEGIDDEPTLFAAMYAVVRGERSAALSSEDALLLRDISLVTWARYEACGGIEQASTAVAVSDSNSPERGSPTGVVSPAPHTSGSCSPVDRPDTTPAIAAAFGHVVAQAVEQARTLEVIA